VSELLSQRFARASADPQRTSLRDSQRAMVEEFEARMTSGEYRLVSEPCPCGESDAVTIAEIDRYGLPLTTGLCRRCGTLRTNPYLDDTSLDHFYRTTYQTMYARAPRLEQYFVNQFGYGERVYSLYEERLPRGASVLEVGCGAGGGLAAFQERGYRVVGCELSRDLVDFGTRLGVTDLCHGTTQELPQQLTSRRFDLIYLHHVFEHVQSPAQTLSELGELLAPQGRILVIVPDITRIDAFPNPAGDALRFLHVAHKYNFTPRCLEIVAAQVGLHAAAVMPPGRLTTVWSEMPELWMEFNRSANGVTQSDARDIGVDVLGYLLETERRFLAHELPAIEACVPSAQRRPRLLQDRSSRSTASRLWNWIRGRNQRRAA
jgi:SAM-dependent methyltransferase